MSQTKVQLVNDVSGNSGFGLSSATGVVHVHKSSSDSVEGLKITNSTTGSTISDGLSIGLQSDEDVFIHNYENTAMLFGTNDTNRLAISSAGNIGVSTTSPVAQTLAGGTAITPVLDLKGVTQNNTSGILQLTRKDHATQGSCIYSSGDDAGLTMRNTDGNGMGFYNGTTIALRIDPSGRTAIGTATTNNPDVGDGGLQIRPNHSGGAPDVHFTRASSSSTSNVVGFVNGNVGVGSIAYTNSGTAFNTSSDYRLKENINSISDGITRVKQLIPKRFNFIDDETNTLRDGFIAHEVTPVVPEAITGEKDAVDSDNKPIYQGIDQAKLVPLLTAALQEEIGKREALESRVATLEAA